MSLESEEASNCNADSLRGFLDKPLDRIRGFRTTFWPCSAVLTARSSIFIASRLRMRAIVSPEGLVATAGELHRAGHPEFRGPKKAFGRLPSRVFGRCRWPSTWKTPPKSSWSA